MIAILLCYALGCLTTGYYLVWLRTGVDIRTLGSRSLGARNVGRALGATGFFMTLLGDIGKGVVAILLARYIGLAEAALPLALLAVVAGHIWPVQLGFQGGKGLATAAGALLIYDPASLLMIAGVFCCAAALLRRVTPGGL